MADDKKPATISEAVKEKFKMKAGFAPGLYTHMGTTIDTTICGLDELAAIVEKGFDVVEPVAAKPQSNKP